MWIFAIGFLAQGFFSARILFQWALSEKAKKVVTPSIYWILSIAGSYLLFIYGWLRNDFAIIFGQLISYYIYLWNLDVEGKWKKIPFIFRLILMITPVVALSMLINDAQTFLNSFLRNEKVPLWLVIYGSMGQAIFTLRFIYQWIYSSRRKQSILPRGFWILSLIGSGTIISYAVIRLDPVLMLGQSVGFIAYIRNLMLLRNERKATV